MPQIITTNHYRSFRNQLNTAAIRIQYSIGFIQLKPLLAIKHVEFDVYTYCIICTAFLPIKPLLAIKHAEH